jgi:hypothetical protein
MGKPFKNNHEVPRSLLKRWISEPDPWPRVWVFDIEKQKLYRSGDTGKRPFSFAIIPDLYVPEVEGTRLAQAEGWFARAEVSVFTSMGPPFFTSMPPP